MYICIPMIFTSHTLVLPFTCPWFWAMVESLPTTHPPIHPSSHLPLCLFTRPLHFHTLCGLCLFVCLPWLCNFYAGGNERILRDKSEAKDLCNTCLRVLMLHNIDSLHLALLHLFPQNYCMSLPFCVYTICKYFFKD